MSRVCWIYALYSTDSPESVRYVGVSVDPNKRLLSHITDHRYPTSFKNNPHKCRWIQNTIDSGNSVMYRLLAEFPDEHSAYAVEDEFIELYKSMGHPITNISRGGSGGILVPEVELDDFYTRRSESHRTAEYRERMSKRAKKLFEDPNIYNKHVAMVREQANDPAWRQKVSEGQKRAAETNDFRDKANITRRLPENREKQRIKAEKQFESLEARDTAREHAKRGWASTTPEQRAQRTYKSKMTARFNKAKKNGWVMELIPTQRKCEKKL